MNACRGNVKSDALTDHKHTPRQVLCRVRTRRYHKAHSSKTSEVSEILMTTDNFNIRLGKNVVPQNWADGYKTLLDLGVKMYRY